MRRPLVVALMLMTLDACDADSGTAPVDGGPTETVADSAPIADSTASTPDTPASAPDSPAPDAPAPDVGPAGPTCPPSGPAGFDEGDFLTDVSPFDCDGQPVSLLELCGQDAGLVFNFYGW